MLKERIALDSDCAILQEYQNKTKPFTGNRAGDAFVKWAIQNQANIERCDVVPLEPNEQRMFESFPDDERLSNFDASDRKFVAVAAAHPDHPKILQAADSKWIDWAPALADHEIEVEFLCPADIHRFHRNKFGR
ncbi:hypothetical protein [Roseimicrobium gellanilyticum]|nr:hypothetical protein [Roseimicrobium gellanilyticum]